MPDLDWITIEGFKSLASVEKLELRPINVVIGPNGAGKSNFIGTFSFLHAIREGRLQNYVRDAGGANKVLHFGAKVTKAIRLHVSFRGERNQYAIALQPTQTDELVPSGETCYFWDRDKYPQGPYSDGLSPRGKEAGISDPNVIRIASHVRYHLGNWRVYHFHDTSGTSLMKMTGDVNDNRFFRPDGSNLAAFLYFLKLKHEESYSLIRRTVQRVAPFFEDFQLEPQKLNSEKILLEWRHRKSDAYFSASSLSDGTLRFIALATLFLQPQLPQWGLEEETTPSVVLVDEPELGLHPYALAMLASLVKQASVTRQVILSTQSPLLLDHFRPEDVLVADRVNEETQLTRPDPEKLKVWLEDYSLGQLWEKNELGGRPA